ncbi:MAG: type III secretion system inner rod subunit SctI [Alphaproteobacteria bacterium]|nr:type III secretion system inner rod subunit SctI [Alphaproteobacteria bacterium]
MTELSGIQQVVQKVVEQGLRDGAKDGGLDKGAASPSDVEKFQAALEQAGAQPPAPEPTAVAEASEKVEGVATAQGASPGQKILDNVQQIRSSYQDTLKEVEQLLRKGTASPADVLAVQTKVQTLTLQQEMLGKVVGKSEQNVDTLLKGQ